MFHKRYLIQHIQLSHWDMKDAFKFITMEGDQASNIVWWHLQGRHCALCALPGHTAAQLVCAFLPPSLLPYFNHMEPVWMLWFGGCLWRGSLCRDYKLFAAYKVMTVMYY